MGILNGFSCGRPADAVSAMFVGLVVVDGPDESAGLAGRNGLSAPSRLADRILDKLTERFRIERDGMLHI